MTTPLREVRISADYDGGDYEAFRRHYFDSETRRPIPSTRVYLGDQLAVEVNSLGCFGPEPKADTPIVGVFGDSVVQGVGDSFVHHMALPGYQAINGGAEGAQLHQIIDHALDVHGRRAMALVAIHSGFHNLLYNETGFMHWEHQMARLKGLPRVALFKLNADINPEALRLGYEPLFGPDYARMHHNKDLATAVAFSQALDRKNRLIEKVAAMWGFAVLDLAPVLAPAIYADLGKRFFDVLHPRPEMYEAMGKSVGAQIAPLLNLTTLNLAERPTSTPMPSAVEQHGRTYPLW